MFITKILLVALPNKLSKTMYMHNIGKNQCKVDIRFEGGYLTNKKTWYIYTYIIQYCKIKIFKNPHPNFIQPNQNHRYLPLPPIDNHDQNEKKKWVDYLAKT